MNDDDGLWMVTILSQYYTLYIIYYIDSQLDTEEESTINEECYLADS